jgi:hypothetical protein
VITKNTENAKNTGLIWCGADCITSQPQYSQYSQHSQSGKAFTPEPAESGLFADIRKIKEFFPETIEKSKLRCYIRL